MPRQSGSVLDGDGVEVADLDGVAEGFGVADGATTAPVPVLAC